MNHKSKKIIKNIKKNKLSTKIHKYHFVQIVYNVIVLDGISRAEIIKEEKEMPNIVLTRIDNRLVHGQVATQWCGTIGANLILVANDEVAGNKLRQGLMDMAAPNYAAMRYWTIEKTISTIHKASDKQLIFIVCETPQDVLKLVEGGVPIKKVNIGNMHMADGKRQVAGSVAVDDDDVAAFAKLRDLGVELEIRRVPSEGAENIEKLFK